MGGEGRGGDKARFLLGSSSFETFLILFWNQNIHFWSVCFLKQKQIIALYTCLLILIFR